MSRGNKCVYYLCAKNPRHNSNLSLFGFPKDLERSRKWITNSGKYVIPIYYNYILIL